LIIPLSLPTSMQAARQQLNVLIIDDHPLVNEALGSVVRSLRPDFTTKHAIDAASARDILRTQDNSSWAMILCDLNLPDLDGLSLAKEIRQALPNRTPIIILSGQDDDLTWQAARLCDIDGFVKKTANTAEMRDAFAAVLSGRQHFPKLPPLTSDAAITEQLSARQLQVLDLLLAGHPNKTIADLQHLSEGTVKNIVSSLFDVFSITSRSRAALITAVRDRLGYRPSVQRPPVEKP
jgi:DNA-binding NarL/FixJ family response regulator